VIGEQQAFAMNHGALSMDRPVANCPKCNGSMHPGVLRDVYHKSLLDEAGQTQEWVASGGVKLPVTTFACGTCGYLESYVNPPQVAGAGAAK
jgi:hypothetical protein